MLNELQSDKIETRIKQLSILADNFCKLHNKELEKASTDIGHAYWFILDNTVKENFKQGSNVDRHKIISTLEIVVCGLKPFGKDKKTNVEFALYLGWSCYLSFYKTIYKEQPDDYDLDVFFREHKKLLELCDWNYKKGSTPNKLLANLIFSNAATWYGIDQYILAKNNKI